MIARLPSAEAGLSNYRTTLTSLKVLWEGMQKRTGRATWQCVENKTDTGATTSLFIGSVFDVFVSEPLQIRVLVLHTAPPRITLAV